VTGQLQLRYCTQTRYELARRGKASGPADRRLNTRRSRGGRLARDLNVRSS